MESVEIIECENTFLYSGIFKRFVAFLIDILICSTIILLISLIWSNLYEPHCLYMDDFMFNSILCSHVFVKIPICFMPCIFYSAFLESSKWQATIGKKMLGIIVTDLDGDRISFSWAMHRTMVKILSIYTLCLGFLMVFMTKKRQALHDKIVRTLVLVR